MSAAMMLEEVRNLPIEERVLFVDAVLQSIYPQDPAVTNRWIETANRRKAEILLGKVAAIPSDEVFEEAYARAR